MNISVSITRTEPSSGGDKRTPREQIEPVWTAEDMEGAGVEPDMAADCSSSEGWADSAGPGVTVWDVQTGAMEQYVAAVEDLDAQASGEAGGGGVYTAFFGSGLVKVGEGDDDGDLNQGNFRDKINAIKVRDEHGAEVPLPYGATYIMPTIRYLDDHYLGEMSKWPDGSPRPVADRPKRARSVWTDGSMRDYEEFGARLAEDNSDKWPDEQWFIAVLGHGDEHDKTLALYRQIAARHPNVHVYSFEKVINDKEIAEDMAVATLSTRQ